MTELVGDNLLGIRGPEFVQPELPDFSKFLPDTPQSAGMQWYNTTKLRATKPNFDPTTDADDCRCITTTHDYRLVNRPETEFGFPVVNAHVPFELVIPNNTPGMNPYAQPWLLTDPGVRLAYRLRERSIGIEAVSFSRYIAHIGLSRIAGLVVVRDNLHRSLLESGCNQLSAQDDTDPPRGLYL